jgi:polar amino acid transport system substrate-binding protein
LFPFGLNPCLAQPSTPFTASPDVGAVSDGVVPNLWDPHLRLEKVDLRDAKTVRILTDDDYPPFSMMDFNGFPTGFSVELARRACQILMLSCEIQVMPFESLLRALDERKGDVIVAALLSRKELRDNYDVTRPYFRNPGRFVMRRESEALTEPSDRILRNKSIVVVAGSAHEMFVKTFFPGTSRISRQDFLAAAQALKNHEADYLFADGVSAALWVYGTTSADCCTLTGTGYLDPRYFGEGIVFTLRKKDDRLRRAFDYALQHLYVNGDYRELYMRFFPVNPH